MHCAKLLNEYVICKSFKRALPVRSSVSIRKAWKETENIETYEAPTMLVGEVKAEGIICN